MNTRIFGLIAQLAQTRIHLPLVHLETRFRIMGEVAVVEMDQVFEQTARESLDVTYTFPLPSAAAVYRCEMIVNGRLIRAVVLEAEEARAKVAEQKAAGRRTALVEMERDNLFTLELGNVAPGDRVVIRFAYVESLDRLGAQLSLRIPFCPGVRYIPGKPLLRTNRGKGVADDTDEVPDASRLTPPRIQAGHEDAATLYLHGVLEDGEVDLLTLDCPTHPVTMRSLSGRIEVELLGEEHVPDRDLVLRWEETVAATPKAHAWAVEKEGYRYALLQVRAPQEVDVKTVDEAEYAQDVYFLLDRSGSMAGLNWQKSIEALHAFVKELGQWDRVWITFFESNYQDFAEQPLKRDTLLTDAKFRQLHSLSTDGGTHLLPALEHVMQMLPVHSAERATRMVLITDGQVGNEGQVLKHMKALRDSHVPVHCFGIDTAVNDALLKAMARRTGGRCVLMTPHEDIPAAVKQLAVVLRSPVLTNLSLSEGVVVADDRLTLPDLHAGEVILMPVQVISGTAQVTLRGSLPDGSAWTQAFNLEEALSRDEAPRLLWARNRTQYLLANGRDNEAVALAVEHNVVCKGTSFAAWDEAEKVPVAKREVYQPSLLALKAEKDAVAAAAFAHGSVASGPASGYRKSAPPPMVETSYEASLPTENFFFEGALKNYLKTSSWDEYSADDLAGGVNPSFASEVVSSGPPSRSRGDKWVSVCKEMEGRYGQLEYQDESCLMTWGLSLLALFMKEGLSSEVARAIVVVLCGWDGEDASGKRHRLLATLVKEMTIASKPLEHFWSFVHLQVTGGDLNNLKKINQYAPEPFPEPLEG
ncbi:hypothetical protein GCM10023213_04530 [Prosthecobacter algae]|uniref:Ca-activated chloride channel family protein n=1 Tax=Prosthecobacter algae TaxID=1144682 RepID=A0ABP9P007_9BACT